jgi:hypothetical protein
MQPEKKEEKITLALTSMAVIEQIPKRPPISIALHGPAKWKC